VDGQAETRPLTCDASTFRSFGQLKSTMLHLEVEGALHILGEVISQLS
jgi:hypothetical protein